MEELEALKNVLEFAACEVEAIKGEPADWVTESMAGVAALIERVEGLDAAHEWAWADYLFEQLRELGLHPLVSVETETVRDWLLPYEEAGDLHEGVVASTTDEQVADILMDASDGWPGDLAWDNLQGEVWESAKTVLGL